MISREMVVNLIASTTTSTGLTVRAVLDENEYEKGKEVSEDDFAAIMIRGEDFHPEWNYTISPQL